MGGSIMFDFELECVNIATEKTNKRIIAEETNCHLKVIVEVLDKQKKKKKKKW